MIDNSGWTVEDRINYLSGLKAGEWEKICKRCGICCLIKYETLLGKTAYTRLSCNELDNKTKKCRIYNHRLKEKLDCYKVDMDTVLSGQLPASCGYVEFIYGPAKYPAVVDFTKVVPVKTVNVDNPFQVMTKYIWGSKKWNKR